MTTLLEMSMWADDVPQHHPHTNPPTPTPDKQQAQTELKSNGVG